MNGRAELSCFLVFAGRLVFYYLTRAGVVLGQESGDGREESFLEVWFG